VSVLPAEMLASDALHDFTERRRWVLKRLKNAVLGEYPDDEPMLQEEAKARVTDFFRAELIFSPYPPEFNLKAQPPGNLWVAAKNLPSALALVGIRPNAEVPRYGKYVIPGCQVLCESGREAAYLLKAAPHDIVICHRILKDGVDG